MKSSNAIDAVITWVDGNDKEHFKKRQKVLAKETDKKENELTTGRDITRFIDNGELKYCIKSIRKFAPWIRTIHLVTDNQVPDFLTPDVLKKDNIHIVDHKEIFESFEWALPTFNTRTIESALWRIPGLAPLFIYFNDDFILTKKVKPSHFFENGDVVLRGKWNSISEYNPFRIRMNKVLNHFAKHALGITRSMHLLQQIRSAELAGFKKKYFRAPHVPHPIRTSTVKHFFVKHPSLFEDNIKYKFRNTEQFSVIFLANHLEIKNKKAVFKSTNDFLMLNGELDFLVTLNGKLQRIRNGQVRFICLQGFESFTENNQDKIRNVLDELLDFK